MRKQGDESGIGCDHDFDEQANTKQKNQGG